MSPLPVVEGTYVVIEIDAKATVEALRDPVLSHHVQSLPTKKYVGFVSRPLESSDRDDPLAAHFSIELVGPTRPWSKETDSVALDGNMCIPIFPTTRHARARRPLRPTAALPFPKCYQHTLAGSKVRATSWNMDNRTGAVLRPRDLKHFQQCVVEDMDSERVRWAGRLVEADPSMASEVGSYLVRPEEERGIFPTSTPLSSDFETAFEYQPSSTSNSNPPSPKTPPPVELIRMSHYPSRTPTTDARRPENPVPPSSTAETFESASTDYGQVIEGFLTRPPIPPELLEGAAPILGHLRRPSSLTATEEPVTPTTEPLTPSAQSASLSHQSESVSPRSASISHQSESVSRRSASTSHQSTQSSTAESHTATVTDGAEEYVSTQQPTRTRLTTTHVKIWLDLTVATELNRPRAFYEEIEQIEIMAREASERRAAEAREGTRAWVDQTASSTGSRRGFITRLRDMIQTFVAWLLRVWARMTGCFSRKRRRSNDSHV